MLDSYPHLYNQEILKYIYNLTVATQLLRITVLNLNNIPVYSLEAIATGGNININGKSAVRRTASLTCAVPLSQNFNITDINSYISINKKVNIEIGIINNGELYKDQEIFWFPEGVFVIKDATIQKNLTSVQISLSLNDKMAMLNGESGGLINSPITFSPMAIWDEENNEYKEEPIHVRALLYSLLTSYGGLSKDEIILEDIPNGIDNLMFWKNDTSLGYIYEDKNEYKLGILLQNGVVNATTYSYGETIGSMFTEFTYPGELTAKAGDTVVSMLDKIKNALGDYEYFFDVQGIFHFQKVKTFLNEGINITDLGAALNTDNLLGQDIAKSKWEFKDSQLISAYSNKPQYNKIKNDIVIWGQDRNTKAPIRYHMILQDEAINYEGETYDLDTAQIRVDDLGNISITSISKGDDKTKNQLIPRDWRQAVYLRAVSKKPQDRTPLEVEIYAELPKIYNVLYNEEVTNGGYLYRNKLFNMGYYIDIITPDNENPDNPLNNFTVEKISKREKTITDKTCNVVMPSFAPNYQFVVGESNKTYNEKKVVSITEEEYNTYLGLGVKMKSCYETLRSMIHEYLSYCNSISLTSIPIYHLEPNTRITIDDKKIKDETGIAGDYVIDSMTIPLAVNGTMSINATLALKRI